MEGLHDNPSLPRHEYEHQLTPLLLSPLCMLSQREDDVHDAVQYCSLAHDRNL